MAHILVIDDDPDICGSLSKMFVYSGHEVKVAHDGEQGIKLFEDQGLFGVVITDIRMQGKDGNEVAKGFIKINEYACGGHYGLP